MEHVQLKATAVATDQGLFEAVISTESVDREKDVVSADAMVAALRKWNRPIPLSWNHGLKAEEIFGHVDPQSARNVNGEVVISGRVDLESAVGGEAWRSFKNRTVGFSFGYLIPDGGSSKRAGGGRSITALDIFEITATPAPMNNDTRVLGTKQVDSEADDATETPEQAVRDAIEELQEFIAAEQDEGDTEDVATARRLVAGLQDLLDAESSEPADADDGKALKAEWSTAYVNQLPDSAFLYVTPGGTKDSDGKTVPRSNRYFPVRDANGNVDQAHVRNALARIPQSNLSQSVKDAATAKARRLLDSSKAAAGSDQETKTSRSVDPLIAEAYALALEFASGGESLRRKPPSQVKTPESPDLPSSAELKRQWRLTTLSALTGDITDG